MLPRLAALSLLVRDYDEAIAFFTGAMDFELIEDSPRGEGKRWVHVAPRGGGSGLVLAQAANERQRAGIGAQGGGRVWLFLHTDDFERDRARMLAHGVKFCEEPRHEPYGIVAVFEDIYGNRWDLLQPADG